MQNTPRQLTTMKKFLLGKRIYQHFLIPGRKTLLLIIPITSFLYNRRGKETNEQQQKYLKIVTSQPMEMNIAKNLITR